MTKFEIKDEFYYDEQPIKIISGAIHYFRVVPEYWLDRLEKLKALGCNTVETYVPWNLHELHEGQFNFAGNLDLRQFIKLADSLALHVILRPAPYICAEWEFGGLPYWLQKYPDLKIRFDNPLFLEKMEQYFEALFKQVVDLQVTNGGPIIMVQVENEYGSYSNDSDYLNKMADLMEKNGVDVPFVTSDGPWGEMLENGSIPGRALPTINCGSKIKEHFARLKQFHGKKRPLMVMEFWIGWFDAWGDEKHHTVDEQVAANELTDILAEGSVNIYMFHGGTNFGFMNGSNYYDQLTPDVTSYDYDALLTEWGDITPKYHAFQKVIAQYTEIPEVKLSTPIKKMDYGELLPVAKTSLFLNLVSLSKKIVSKYPLTMEEVNQSTGYIYYQTQLGPAKVIDDFRLLGANDRAHIFINDQLQFIQYDLELGQQKSIELVQPENKLGILVENMGRVNYSVKMNQQQKGIRDGVIINAAYQSNWEIYSLPMDNLTELNFGLAWMEKQPSFYLFELNITEVGDTFIDLSGWGKGFVMVNQFNIGRFWEKGPQQRLYIPGPLLHEGMNEIIIFESEGKISPSIHLTAEPKLDR